jgi:hypothetical protein
MKEPACVVKGLVLFGVPFVSLTSSTHIPRPRHLQLQELYLPVFGAMDRAALVIPHWELLECGNGVTLPRDFDGVRLPMLIGSQSRSPKLMHVYFACRILAHLIKLPPTTNPLFPTSS